MSVPGPEVMPKKLREPKVLLQICCYCNHVILYVTVDDYGSGAGGHGHFFPGPKIQFSLRLSLGIAKLYGGARKIKALISQF